MDDSLGGGANRFVGRYFLITEEEAKDTFGDPRYKDFWNEGDGGYVTGLEVLHTLHCVNQVRMALHQDYYTEHAGNPRNGMHWGESILTDFLYDSSSELYFRLSLT